WAPRPRQYRGRASGGCGSPEWRTRVWARCSPGRAGVSHELEQIDAGDDPDRPLGFHHYQGGGAPEQRIEGLVDVGAGGDRWKGPIHRGTDRGVDQTGITV